jgi:serine protease Do
MNRFLILGVACFALLYPYSPTAARGVQIDEAGAVRRAAPAVVSISVWKLDPPKEPGGPRQRVKFYGSGFVIDPSGIIVTNKHVIDGAIDIKAVFVGGNVLPAKLIRASSLLDLAALKVDAGHPLPAVEWGDSNALQVGDPVLTIGNGLDWATSVSAGIVSGLNRNIMDSPFDSYIQTDATVNHGNSGGPLVDRDGKVVGVTTALYNPNQNGGFIGIGFAIPASTAEYDIKTLLDPNSPPPGWLGFNLQDMTGQLAEALGVPRPTGAIISSVDPSGPASHASLRSGDVLEQFNGKPVEDSRALMRAIAETRVGDQVRLVVWRVGKEQEVSAAVAAWPNSMPGGGVMTGAKATAMMAMAPSAGVKLAALSDADRKQYGLNSDQTGVLVTGVDPGSEVSELGVQPGSVITAVQGAPVTTPDEVWNAVKLAHEQHRPYLAVLVQSKNGEQWISLSLSATNS